MAEVPEEKQLPLLVLAQDLHEYGLLLKLAPGKDAALRLKEKLIGQLLEQSMADQYVQLCATYHWEVDESKVTSMRWVYLSLMRS